MTATSATRSSSSRRRARTFRRRSAVSTRSTATSTSCWATSSSRRRRSMRTSPARATCSRSCRLTRRPRPSGRSLLRREAPDRRPVHRQLDGMAERRDEPLLRLLALSVIVSLFGMVNTLVLAVFERTRDLGMLRAVGMTRRQTRRMIRHESVITALIGAALGLPLGVGLAALVTQSLSKYGVSSSPLRGRSSSSRWSRSLRACSRQSRRRGAHRG